MREFVFKFQHNLLGLNTRVSHFNENVPRSCTFCLVNPNNQQPIPDETFLHLFFDCKFTQIVRRQFINQFLFDLNLNDVTAEKNFFFLSINPSSGKNDNLFISLISRLFMFFIWQCKLNKKLPTISNLLNDIFFLGENIRRSSSIIREQMTINLFICRVWTAEASRRR
jgi:hypothetical protein